MTYRDDYTEHLRQAMADGGTPAAMDAAVNEYNDAERPAWKGSAGFTAWANVRAHRCAICDAGFVLPAVTTVNPDDEPKCEKCRDVT